MRRTRLFLDANVLVDAQLRDTFLRLEEADLVSLRWSDAVLEEAHRALTGRMRLDETKIDRLFVVLRESFPGAVVEGYEGLTSALHLPDPGDQHVLAAAILGECDLLVTNNLVDFPHADLERHDVLAVRPDDALMLTYFKNPQRVLDGLARQRMALTRPAMAIDEFLHRLSRRAPMFAAEVAEALGIEL
jgi:predicted nucleic acid-binding protein